MNPSTFSNEGYEPLPWLSRAQTAPHAPGPIDTWVKRLPVLLDALTDSATPKAIIAAPGVDRPVTAEDLLRQLGSALTTRVNGVIRPTAEATAWRFSADPKKLILLLHRRVRLVGEILSLLSDGPLPMETLLERANTRYAMGWTTLDQLRRRTAWLRGAGMVEYYDLKLHLTESGRDFLAILPLGEPAIGASTTAAKVSAPAPAIEEDLQRIAVNGHDSRSEARSLFLPSPEGQGTVAALRTVVTAAMPSVRESELDKLMETTCTLAEDSARQARGSLKTLGLVARTGPAQWSATRCAQAWLESDDPVDLVRIVHTHVWYVGEILEERSAGAASAKELAERSVFYGREKVGIQSVHARLRLLRDCRAVEKLSQKDYQLTPIGRGLRTVLPIASRTIAAGEDFPSTTTDSPADTPSRSICTTIAAELRDASRDSSRPQRMELAVRDALSWLGLEAEHLGGPGKADAFAALCLPADRLLIAVEAKTTASGLVAESQVSFQGLEEHRKKLGAARSVVIGPAFDSRVHAAAAKDGHVAILSAETLAEAVELHGAFPFSPLELEALFDPGLAAGERGEVLKQSHSSRVDLFEVLHAVIVQLDDEIRHESPMYEGGWLRLADLRRDLRRLNVSAEIVGNALELLSSPFLGVVEQNRDQFRLVVPIAVVAARLRSLAVHMPSRSTAGR